MIARSRPKTVLPATSGKHWRLTYSTLGVNTRFGRVQSWLFLTVAEALEHARLNSIVKFRLEDLPTKVH